MEELISNGSKSVDRLYDVYSKGHTYEGVTDAIIETFKDALPDKSNGIITSIIKTDPTYKESIRVNYPLLRLYLNTLDIAWESEKEAYKIIKDGADIDKTLLASYLTVGMVYNTIESFYFYLVSRGIVGFPLSQVTYAYQYCFNKKIPISGYQLDEFALSIPQIRNSLLDSTKLVEFLADERSDKDIAKVFNARASAISESGYEKDNLGTIYHYLEDAGFKKRAQRFLDIDSSVIASDETRIHYGLPISKEKRLTLKKKDLQ